MRGGRIPRPGIDGRTKEVPVPSASPMDALRIRVERDEGAGARAGLRPGCYPDVIKNVGRDVVSHEIPPPER